MESSELKAKYDKISKKYKLLDFEYAEKEFELSLIEHPPYLVKELVHKLFDKIDSYAKFLEPLFQPDTNSISEMNEYHFLPEQKREELFDFYKTLMRKHRELIAASIENNDEKSLVLLSKIMSEWDSIKSRLTDLSNLLSTSWVKSPDVKYNLDYLG